MKTRTRQSNAACAQMPERIIETLKRTPLTILELSAELKFSRNAVRDRLALLRDEGKVHFVQVPTKGNLGMSHVWHVGPAPQGLAIRMRRMPGNSPARIKNCRDLPTRQTTVRAFPAINRRDPLVSALFGPAHKEAA